jgi:hypothetical protein
MNLQRKIGGVLYFFKLVACILFLFGQDRGAIFLVLLIISIWLSFIFTELYFKDFK